MFCIQYDVQTDSFRLVTIGNDVSVTASDTPERKQALERIVKELRALI